MVRTKKSKSGKCCNQPGIPSQEYPSCGNLSNAGSEDGSVAAALSSISTALLAVQSNMLTFNSTIVRLSDQIKNLGLGKIEDDDQKRRIDELETKNKQLEKQLAEQEIRLTRLEEKSLPLNGERSEEDENSDTDEECVLANKKNLTDFQLDIHNLYTWKNSSSFTTLPTDAVQGACDINGTPIYVGRSNYNGYSLPAKIFPEKKIAYVTYDGREIAQDQYEFLCGTGFSWVASAYGQVPAHAVSTYCTSSSDEKLYIGRAKFDGLIIPGKVHLSDCCLYFGYEGAEVGLTSYEVLVYSASWVSSNIHGSVPKEAVVAGYDNDGAIIYVGRAPHAGNMLPAKVIPQRIVCYVPYDGNEITTDDFEILTGTGFTWVKSAGGKVPPNAVIGGITSDGEHLYVGRAHHNYSLTPGKVHPSHRCLYLPYGCLEHRHNEYEVLVKSPAS